MKSSRIFLPEKWGLGPPIQNGSTKTLAVMFIIYQLPNRKTQESFVSGCSDWCPRKSHLCPDIATKVHPIPKTMFFRVYVGFFLYQTEKNKTNQKTFCELRFWQGIHKTLHQGFWSSYFGSGTQMSVFRDDNPECMRFHITCFWVLETVKRLFNNHTDNKKYEKIHFLWCMEKTSIPDDRYHPRLFVSTELPL